MKINLLVNKDGAVQKSDIEFPLCVSGGEAGKRAVDGLMVLIENLNNISDPGEIVQHWFSCCGYALCCIHSGFLEDESTDKMMHTIGDLLVDDLIAMAKKKQEEKNAPERKESNEETKGV